METRWEPKKKVTYEFMRGGNLENHKVKSVERRVTVVTRAQVELVCA